MIVGSGVDVIEIARIERVLGDRGDRFERRVFHPDEIATCRASARPALHYAVRFAAKEALMKAVGTGWARGVRWADIETLAGEGAGGRISDGLQLRLHGRVAELAALRTGAADGAARTHLAVSRSRSHAMAVVLLEAGPGAEPG